MNYITAPNSFPNAIGLKPAVEKMQNFLDDHTLINKIVVVVNHFFRTACMVAMMMVMPFSLPINIALGLAGSIFYGLTIERICHFQFAIPDCLAAATFLIAQPALSALISGVAFNSILIFALSVVTVIPFIAAVTMIVLLANKNVDTAPKKKVVTACCYGAT